MGNSTWEHTRTLLVISAASLAAPFVLHLFLNHTTQPAASAVVVHCTPSAVGLSTEAVHYADPRQRSRDQVKCYDAAAKFSDRDSLLRIRTEADNSSRPHCLILDYCYQANKMKLHHALHDSADLLPLCVRTDRRLIAWRAAPKLRNLVTFYFSHPTVTASSVSDIQTDFSLGRLTPERENINRLGRIETVQIDPVSLAARSQCGM